jgi:hypothetical protein
MPLKLPALGSSTQNKQRRLLSHPELLGQKYSLQYPRQSAKPKDQVLEALAQCKALIEIQIVGSSSAEQSSLNLGQGFCGEARKAEWICWTDVKARK